MARFPPTPKRRVHDDGIVLVHDAQVLEAPRDDPGPVGRQGRPAQQVLGQFHDRAVGSLGEEARDGTVPGARLQRPFTELDVGDLDRLGLDVAADSVMVSWCQPSASPQHSLRRCPPRRV